MRKQRPSNLGPGRPGKPVDAQRTLILRDPIGRRAFVKTSGGIFLAATGLAACGGDPVSPSQLGTVIVKITGLASGLLDGGSAVITRTDIAGQAPLTLIVPASGNSESQVPAGTYRAVYTPPAGYQVVGVNVFDVTIQAAVTTTVSVTVSVVATQGTLRVVVTGLTAAALSGGSASLLRSGQAPIVVPIPLSAGLPVDTVVAAGVYQVTYTPPAGWSLVVGTTNPQTVTVAVGATAPATFPVILGPVGFVTPDILDNASFESDFSYFKNGSAQPPTGVTRDTTHAWSPGNVDAPGQFSVRKVLPVTSGGSAGDIGSSFFFGLCGNTAWWPGPARQDDRLWGRFYFYFDAAIDGILKFQLWEDCGFNKQFGGFYCVGGNIVWAFIDHIGAGTISTGNMPRIATLASVVRGWHSLEVEYWRVGHPSGQPAAKLYLDGAQLRDFTLDPQVVAYGAKWDPTGYLLAGPYYSGAGYNTAKLATYNLLGVLNGGPPNTIAGNVWIDRVSISSLGRIGP